MKNIHLLLTNKPSSLGYDGNKTLHLTNMFIDDYVNIYITSDEEIRVNDYITDGYKVWKWKDDSSLLGRKKIILTTDQDLIKDGVQAIPDEFLEWFVKNPSCEFVMTLPDVKGLRDIFQPTGKNLYKIIIPKEEQKSLIEKMKPLQEQWQKDMDSVLNPKEESELKCDFCKRYPRLEGTNKCESCYSVVRHFLEQDQEFKDKLLPDLRKKQETLENHYLSTPNSLVDTSRMKLDNHPDLKGKQETIEEVAFKHTRGKPFKEMPSQMDFINGAVFGAKWQAERMYSEEEAGELVYNIIGEYAKHYGIMIDGLKLNELFEQFKKR